MFDNVIVGMVKVIPQIIYLNPEPELSNDERVCCLICEASSEAGDEINRKATDKSVVHVHTSLIHY